MRHILNAPAKRRRSGSLQLGDAIYTAGQDGVAANIDKYGNLIIQFQTTRATIRRLIYKYGREGVSPGSGSNHYLSTIGANLQEMPFPSSVSVKSCPLYEDESARQYRHSFNRDCQSGFEARGEDLGSALLVTRIDASTWVVEPDPATAANARAFAINIKGRGDVTDFGLISLPFKRTLRAK